MVQKVFAGEVSETVLLRRRREADQFSLGDQVDLRSTDVPWRDNGDGHRGFVLTSLDAGRLASAATDRMETEFVHTLGWSAFSHRCQ